MENQENQENGFTSEEPIRINKPVSWKAKIEDYKERIKNFFANPKKRLYFIIGAGVALIALFGLGLYFLTHESNANKEKDKEQEMVLSTDYQAPLDGVLTTEDAANRHPLAIIVENHPAARPQAGLDKASIVYEAVAEGGITRFMGVFGTHEAEKVGPVRSARTYFVDWMRGYDAWFAHVGGNIDALDQIKAEKVNDLDQFTNPMPYWRERNRNVSSEHTMFTSTIKLREQADKNNYPKANNFTVYKFKDIEKAAEADNNTDKDTESNNVDTASDGGTDLAATKKTGSPATTIRVNFSSGQYNVVFNYDTDSNSYKREMGGSAHSDQITKNQLAPTNIIVMRVSREATTTRINEAGYNMSTVGNGKATIFIDGKAIDGTWKKNSKEDRELFYDADGQEIVFNRGQFWICVVHPDAEISYN